MKKTIIFSLFGIDPHLRTRLQSEGYLQGELAFREFPDEEIYLKISSDIKNSDVIFVDSLDKPNGKILPLIFAAQTAKDLGARQIGLVTPYLSYMRQDKRFNPGEAITSNYFAKLISSYFDWLVTVDPHLHRHSSLSEIYSIPNTVVHASACISDWIKANITNPLVIGPDSESEQWVSQVAKDISAPYLILEKIRKGDRDVEVSKPATEPYESHTPILVDDIISTAKTMIETITHLNTTKLKAPICIGVHAIFAKNAYVNLVHAGARDVITCNSIPHPTNKIDLSTILVNAITEHTQKGE